MLVHSLPMHTRTAFPVTCLVFLTHIPALFMTSFIHVTTYGRVHFVAFKERANSVSQSYSVCSSHDSSTSHCVFHSCQYSIPRDASLCLFFCKVCWLVQTYRDILVTCACVNATFYLHCVYSIHQSMPTHCFLGEPNSMFIDVQVHVMIMQLRSGFPQT